MNVYEPGQHKRNRARERSMARRSRREGSGLSALKGMWEQGGQMQWRHEAGLWLAEAWWYFRHTPLLQIGLLGGAAVLFSVFVLSHLFTGRIFPNVWSLGVNLGDQTVEDAAKTLSKTWDTTFKISLSDGKRIWDVEPAQIGLSLDADQTAAAARGVGMAGLPMGWKVQPHLSFDSQVAQEFLLNMSVETDIPAVNAGFAWQDGQLMLADGVDGQMLDIPSTVDWVQANLNKLGDTWQINLSMNRLTPLQDDSSEYLAQAQQLVSNPPTLYGYDPFINETVSWSTTPAEFTSWLQVTDSGLTLREETYGRFMEAQNQSLNPPGASTARYLDPITTKEKLRDAIANRTPQVYLRIRYRPSEYTVERGDTGYRIARKTGIPFFKIEEVNPGRDLGALYPGDTISLPPPDVTLPIDPVPNKRIVVNLNAQTLVAFENGQVKFSWLISSGLEKYPTSPGIYQVLSHEDVAYGSSFNLCNEDSSCGQWEMYWFMGMYEVGPGFMNGFHGAVLLPNGAYLGGGNVGDPYTYGCVMSRDDNAKLLYDWADDGTVVEVVSSEYSPRSILGQEVWTQPLESFTPA